MSTSRKIRKKKMEPETPYTMAVVMEYETMTGAHAGGHWALSTVRRRPGEPRPMRSLGPLQITRYSEPTHSPDLCLCHHSSGKIILLDSDTFYLDKMQLSVSDFLSSVYIFICLKVSVFKILVYGLYRHKSAAIFYEFSNRHLREQTWSNCELNIKIQKGTAKLLRPSLSDAMIPGLSSDCVTPQPDPSQMSNSKLSVNYFWSKKSKSLSRMLF